MNHPTKEQVQTVIDNLTSVLPRSTDDNQLDMSEPHVNTDGHRCGTVHCHAGWYAVAVFKDPVQELDYSDGAFRMATDLGFMSAYALCQWARDNYDLWGNIRGDEMFSYPRAFTPGDKVEADNLQDIIDHWKEVRDRLPE